MHSTMVQTKFKQVRFIIHKISQVEFEFDIIMS
jgi:hypothetical protein